MCVCVCVCVCMCEREGDREILLSQEWKKDMRSSSRDAGKFSAEGGKKTGEGLFVALGRTGSQVGPLFIRFLCVNIS